MPQPFHAIELALQRGELVNPALNYDPQSRAMPIISMQPLPPTIVPTSTQPCAPLCMPPSMMTTGASQPYRAAPIVHSRPTPTYVPYEARGPLPESADSGGPWHMLFSPGLWLVIAFLVLCYQTGARHAQPAAKAHPTNAQHAAKSAPCLQGSGRLDQACRQTAPTR